MSISRQEFARRRRNLMAQMEPDSIAVLQSAPLRTRNKDVEYPFRQDSDFFYLTGFDEPEAVAVLIPERDHGEFVVFCRERDVEMETWHGYRSGPEGVCKKFAADDAFPIGDIDEILPGLIEGRERLYYDMGKDSSFDQIVMGWVNTIREQVRNGAHPPGEFLALDHLLHDLRLYKSAAEIKLMRESAQIAAAAHIQAMKVCQPGMMEYELEAEYLYAFRRKGCNTSYPPIVGGGRNGCILHYIENRDELNDGDLVLVDAGAELEYYASDITRTFPVNGKFTPEQKALYELVLKSQTAAIEQVKPGNHWNDPHNAVVRVITEGLLELNILSGDIDDLIELEAYKPLFMHRTGHWIGLDVHDVGDYKVDDEWRVLEAGMVLTIEPGLYIAHDNKEVAKKWRGIGIRIEDDVLVTKQGHEVLSEAAPKSLSAIEKLMKSKRKLS